MGPKNASSYRFEPVRLGPVGIVVGPAPSGGREPAVEVVEDVGVLHQGRLHKVVELHCAAHLQHDYVVGAYGRLSNDRVIT